MKIFAVFPAGGLRFRIEHASYRTSRGMSSTSSVPQLKKISVQKRISSIFKHNNLGWAATNEKATNCRILSLFCRIFGGRQIATARNLKSDNLSLFCRLFVAFFVFFRTFLWFLDLKIFLFVRNSLIFVPIRLFVPDVTILTVFLS